jgi:hypothetical protein
MTGRRRIDERIEKKEQEIQELEMKIREAKAYIQALQDIVRFLPKDGDTAASSGDSESSLREGSYISDAKNAIQAAGKPLHVVEILKALGRDNNRKNRIGMSGSLAAYVRRNEIFTRPRPNTFGLISAEKSVTPPKPAPASSPTHRGTPPEDFGIDEGDENTTH